MPEDVTAVPVGDPGVAFDVVHADDDGDRGRQAGRARRPPRGRRRTAPRWSTDSSPASDDLAGHEWRDPARPGIVHRLDKGTSGLLVVARTPAAADNPDRAAPGAVGRPSRTSRWCRATSRPTRAPSTHPSAARAATAPGWRSPPEAARRARTTTVTRRFDTPRALTLLELKLDTGRTHQIRVHLAAIGHPVVADPRYGGDTAGLGLSRPFLHAASLSFDHPTDGTRPVFTAACRPTSWRRRSVFCERASGEGRERARACRRGPWPPCRRG